MAVLKARQRVSVLDAVLADYQHVVSDAGGYSPSIRSLISNHMDTVRELEKRAVGIQLSVSGQGPADVACKPPRRRRNGLDSRPAVNGLNPKTTPYFQAMWSIMVDLYVLAMRCDLVRFGNLLSAAAATRIRTPVPPGARRTSTARDSTCGVEPGHPPIVNDHMLWTMTRIAELFQTLDDPAFRDVDGGSLLDNTTLVIGTELGDDVANHGMIDMPFWIAGGAKRFKPGDFLISGGHSDVDLYNTVLRT